MAIVSFFFCRLWGAGLIFIRLDFYVNLKQYGTHFNFIYFILSHVCSIFFFISLTNLFVQWEIVFQRKAQKKIPFVGLKESFWWR